jgi:two-component system, OmpR family, copper resistance phosphate regulon response regulator CusR
MKLLLIEDEPKTVQSLSQGLKENGFEVDFCYDGSLGLHMAKKDTYDVIVSDIIMPGLNGIELCKELRKEGITTPILMLTALGDLQDKVQGFDAGADDYLIKPFEFVELMMRIRALGRRSSTVPFTNSKNTIHFADLEMNFDTKTATRSGHKIALTAKEFSLMEMFIRNQGKVISKPEIAEKVWDISFDSGTNVIEVYINLLRKKIDKDFPQKLIHNVYGMGYVLKNEE